MAYGKVFKDKDKLKELIGKIKQGYSDSSLGRYYCVDRTTITHWRWRYKLEGGKLRHAANDHSLHNRRKSAMIACVICGDTNKSYYSQRCTPCYQKSRSSQTQLWVPKVFNKFQKIIVLKDGPNNNGHMYQAYLSHYEIQKARDRKNKRNLRYEPARQ